MKLRCLKNRKLTVVEKWALESARGITNEGKKGEKKGGPTLPTIGEYNLAIKMGQYVGKPIEN